jgi:hypothetical protein
VNRRRHAGASGVPVSAATSHLAAHGRALRDDHEKPGEELRNARFRNVDRARRSSAASCRTRASRTTSSSTSRPTRRSTKARATHEEPRHTAKTLLLHDRDGCRIAVLPANRRLDLEKSRRPLGVACLTE